jgi:hypothetical protein
MNNSDVNSEAGDELTEKCLALFDTLCERRSVLPLVYLMHAWPMTDRSNRAQSMLFETLRDLKKWHSDSLTQDERQLIEQILELDQALRVLTG